MKVDGVITFMRHSSDWNETTSSGCVIENAVLTSNQQVSAVFIQDSSPKINNCAFLSQSGIYIQESDDDVAGPLVSNNLLLVMDMCITNYGGNSSIINNTLTGCLVGVYILGGAPIVAGNLIVNCTGDKINGFGGIRIDYQLQFL